MAWLGFLRSHSQDFQDKKYSLLVRTLASPPHCQELRSGESWWSLDLWRGRRKMKTGLGRERESGTNNFQNIIIWLNLNM